MTYHKLFKETFQIKESNCTVITDKQTGIETAKASIRHHRELLEAYIKENPKFLHSFEPVTVEAGPQVAVLMAEAAKRANVGPMAAVAGVLADLAAEDMVNAGCKVAVVENGGEISAIADRPIDIGFAAGEQPLSNEMAFRLKQFPIGVATSSGQYSHAFSFGDADAVTIFAVNAGVADAAATAVANMIKGDDADAVIRAGIQKALNIKGVTGVFILYRGIVGKAGHVPDMVKVKE
jgi:ApbE superfamily uncharacterized protein (UPF0280 family)